MSIAGAGTLIAPLLGSVASAQAQSAPAQATPVATITVPSGTTMNGGILVPASATATNSSPGTSSQTGTTGTSTVPTTDVSVNIEQGATINAPGNGVDVQTAQGGAITVGNAGAINAGNIGILARSGLGAISITNASQIAAPIGIASGSTAGVTTITNSGSIGGATVGIAAGSGGPVSVINANGGRITFGQLGIAGASASTLTLTNNGTLTQNTSLPGQLTQAQLASLPAPYQGVAPSSPAAIFGRTFGGDLRVTNAGQITGQAGIDAAVLNGQNGSASGRLIITNSGSITATSGPAIDTTKSVVAAQIQNSGVILGSINLNNNSANTFANSGTLNVGGTSSFGGGTFTNTGILGLIPAVATTTTGTTTGTTTAVLAPSIVQLTNVSSLYNAGVINLSTGTAANKLIINGNYVGGQLNQNGTAIIGSGKLMVDASSTTNGADQLIILGSASGNTSVLVRSISPTTTAFSKVATIVSASGTIASNAFTLGATQNFGTMQPTLVSSSAGGVNTISINAVPNAVAASAPTAVVATRTIATQGTSAVLDRVQQLRDTKVAGADIAPAAATPLAYAPMGYSALISKDPISQNVVQPTAPVDNSVKVATWARATGDLERRTGSTSYVSSGSLFTRDLGYTQQTGALLGGADAVISGLTTANDGLILGVLGGYNIATVNLNNNAGRQDYNGGTVGTYATYLNGPLFVDALFKVDLLGLDIIAPGLRQSTGLTNYSFATNVGYRIPLERGVYVEPTAGLDYVDTQFNRTASLTASTVPLHNGDALRGRIGTRIGSEVIVDNVRVEPSLTTYVYTVLTESNPSGVFNGLTSVTGIRDQGKVRGEVQAALNVFDLKSGISGFVRADMRVGGDLLAGGGRVGVRYTW